MKISVDRIYPNPQQPRLSMDEGELNDLADSIRLHGVINPISVMESGDGWYILIDGERRWRAARMAGLTEIEASVRPAMNGAGEIERLVLGTVANLKRADMNPIERATAFSRLLERGMSMAEIARAVGVTPSTVGYFLKMLEMVPEAQQAFAEKKIPADHRVVRALSLCQPEIQKVIAHTAARRPMTANTLLGLIGRLGSAHMARRRHNSTRPEELWTGAHWNMIAQAGNPALSATLRAAAEETCQACALYEEANRIVCRECPAVVLLLKLAEIHHE